MHFIHCYSVLKTEAEVFQAKESRDRLAANNIDLFIGTVEFVETPLYLASSGAAIGIVFDIYCRYSYFF